MHLYSNLESYGPSNSFSLILTSQNLSTENPYLKIMIYFSSFLVMDLVFDFANDEREIRPKEGLHSNKYYATSNKN